MVHYFIASSQVCPSDHQHAHSPYDSLKHVQFTVVIRDPLIKIDLIVSPPTTPIAQLSFQRFTTIRQPDVPRAGCEVTALRPLQTAVAVGEAVIQIEMRRMMVPLNIDTLRHQRATTFHMHLPRAGREVAGHDSTSRTVLLLIGVAGAAGGAARA